MDRKVQAIINMGKYKMLTWWIFGFQWWGAMRPACMWTKAGKYYEPLEFGLWIRVPSQDRRMR